MNRVFMGCLLMVGLINFVPLLGLFSATGIESTYGVKLADQNLALLMRHRALLFGIVGGFVLLSIWVAQYQKAAMWMSGISMTGFAILVMQTVQINQAISNVLIVDLIGLGFLSIGVLIKWKSGYE